MENVVALPGHQIAAPGEPDAELVKFIEDLLDDARSGVVRAIAVAEVRTNGCISHGWAFAPKADLAIGSALFRLQHAYAKYLFERGE